MKKFNYKKFGDDLPYVSFLPMLKMVEKYANEDVLEFSFKRTKKRITMVEDMFRYNLFDFERDTCCSMRIISEYRISEDYISFNICPLFYDYITSDLSLEDCIRIYFIATTGGDKNENTL